MLLSYVGSIPGLCVYSSVVYSMIKYGLPGLSFASETENHKRKSRYMPQGS